MGIFFQIDSEVIRTVGSESFYFGLAKNICVLVIFLWNGGEINFFRYGSGLGLYCGTELDSKYF